MILIDLDDTKIDMLIECKKTKLRGFDGWELKSLINEAIFEFYQKYGKEANE